jgi:hypothetical protein
MKDNRWINGKWSQIGLRNFVIEFKKCSLMDQKTFHGKELLNQSSFTSIHQSREYNIDLEASIEINYIADDFPFFSEDDSLRALSCISDGDVSCRLAVLQGTMAHYL